MKDSQSPVAAQSLDLDFPPENKQQSTLVAFLVATPIGALFTAVLGRWVFAKNFLEVPRQIPYELIVIGLCCFLGVAVLVRWLQRLRDPGPVRVTWDETEFVEWNGAERRTTIARSAARGYLGELHVSYQTASGTETARTKEARVCQISDDKGQLITVCDGTRTFVPWLDHRRSHAASIEAIIKATNRLPKAGDKLQLDDRARARHDSRIYVWLSLLGYPGVIAALGVFVAPSSRESSLRESFLGLLAALALLLLRSLRPLTELLSRVAERPARRSAAVELVLRLALLAALGLVVFGALGYEIHHRYR